MAIGNTDPENTYSYGGVEKGQEDETMMLYSILDTGTSALNFSYHYYDDFISKIFEYVGGDDYVVQQGIVITRCYGNFPSLYFMFNDMWIEIKPNEYVKDISPAQDLTQCLLLIMSSSMPVHILGMPLFHDYYTIHEMDTGRIGFAPHIRSRKTRLQDAVMPTQTLKSNGNMKKRARTYAYIIITAISSTCAVVYTFAIYPAMKDADWTNGSIALLTFGFFFVTTIVLYVWIAPAVMRGLGGATMFMNKKEIEAATNIVRAVFISVSLFVFIALTKYWINKGKKKEVVDSHAHSLVILPETKQN